MANWFKKSLGLYFSKYQWKPYPPTHVQIQWSFHSFFEIYPLTICLSSLRLKGLHLPELRAFIYLFVCLFACLFICLFAYLFIYYLSLNHIIFNIYPNNIVFEKLEHLSTFPIFSHQEIIIFLQIFISKQSLYNESSRTQDQSQKTHKCGLRHTYRIVLDLSTIPCFY